MALNIDDLMKQIGYKSDGSTNFNRDQVKTALNIMRSLKSQLANGQISQQDYIGALNAIAPGVDRRIQESAGSGKGGADEIRQAGGDTFTNEFTKEYRIQQSAQQYLGRPLDQTEIASAMPYFQGPEGETNVNAYLANIATQQKQDPTNANSPSNPNNPKNTLSQFNPQVNQVFQDLLKRGATQDELNHFSSLISTGQADPYQLQAYVKTLPEYTNAQDTQFRTGLNDELSKYDTAEFGREKQGILSQYAQNGQGGGASPSLDYALTNLMGNIAEKRSNYLAGLSAQQYGGNKDLAAANYGNTMNQAYQQSQQDRSNSLALNNTLLNRGFQGADYQQQMSDYMNYLNNRPKPNNTLAYINTGLNTINTAGNLYANLNK